LEGVAPDEVQLLIQAARRRRFSRNEVVVHRGDPGDSVHLIDKGRFSIQVMSPLGDIVTIGLRGPGDCFGEMALLDDDPRRTATVTALEDAETFSIYRDDFEQLRRQHPEVTEGLFRFLVSEVRMLNERLLEAFYLPVHKRVLRRLNELVAFYPEDAEGHPVILLTQEALAGLVGTTRATVNTVLRDEEKRGLIKLGNRRIQVLDPESLAARAR
jgi:CRP-like cAMP-binding protein